MAEIYSYTYLTEDKTSYYIGTGKGPQIKENIKAKSRQGVI